MTLVGQSPPSAALQKALELLSEGKQSEAETVVKKAALSAKAQHGSGSHPLALAYAEMARYHLRVGELERAAQEFQHASRGGMPSDPQERRDRLSFMFGYGVALGELGKLEDAEKVLRQCLAFARNTAGGQSPSAYVALVPLADVLLKAGKTPEATKLANDAYDALWKLGDPLFTAAVGTRAEALKAAGKSDNPFADLTDLPDDMVTAAVATTLARAGKGDTGRVRAVLADLLGFVDKKFGDGHTITCDTLAAVAHHEAAAGSRADEKVRKTAVRRAVWSYAVRRVPGGLLSNLEVGFEPGGGIHLAPHLMREPNAVEAAQVEQILTEAVDDLYARPILRPLIRVPLEGRMNASDSGAFPPTIQELLTLLPVAPLGPGIPVHELHDRLAALTDAAFGSPITDPTMASCCRAALWLGFNFLDESHRISQEINTREGSYWHALMHRREPDHANAAYWFRRVGPHPVFETLREAAAELAVSPPTEGSFLRRQSVWDPFAFNDLCERSAAETAPAHDLCRRVQRAEWELLFAWCFNKAVS